MKIVQKARSGNAMGWEGARGAFNWAKEEKSAPELRRARV